MKNTIEVKVKRIGHLTGSCGWVAAKLETAEVEREGRFIFVSYKKGTDKDGKPVICRKKVCGVVANPAIEENAHVTSDGAFWYAYTSDTDLGLGYQKYVLFDVPLTDAAREIAHSFLMKCLDALREEWESDDNDNQ